MSDNHWLKLDSSTAVAILGEKLANADKNPQMLKVAKLVFIR